MPGNQDLTGIAPRESNRHDRIGRVGRARVILADSDPSPAALVEDAIGVAPVALGR